MKKRGVIIISAVLTLGVAGLLASLKIADLDRQEVRIYLHDTAHTWGLGTGQWALEHMQSQSGLQDVSNVSCRHCHGITLEQLPWNQPRPRHPSPEGLAMAPDGSWLFAALPDVDQVVAIDTASLKVVRSLGVPGSPTGLALDPDGETLYVTARMQDELVAVRTADLARQWSVPVGLEPVGVAVCRTSAGDRVVVANVGSHNASVVDVTRREELTRLATGREPYGVTSTPDGSRALVACRLSNLHAGAFDEVGESELTIIDPVRPRVVLRQFLHSSHLSESVGVVPQRSWVITPLVRVRNLVPITQVARGWVMSAGLAVSRLDGPEVIQLPLDEANRYFADPAGLAVHPDGSRAYLAAGGSDVVTVVDLDRMADWLENATEDQMARAIHNMELAYDWIVTRIPTRQNPRQLVLSPDGSRLYIGERLADTILVVDTTSHEPIGRVVLGGGGDRDPIRRGERIFNTAAKTFQGQFSCRSCHPDGHVDGLTYDFDGDGVGDNLLDNRSLRGLAGTWPFKWVGSNPSLKVQCGPRFAKVLMRTDPFTDAELSDLVRFLDSMPPARTQRVHDMAPTPAQERGREIFFATHQPDGTPIPRESQCHFCHAPPLFTSRMKTAVGTFGPYSTTDEFDTPHLLGIAASAPYLHDGRARTLEELWTVYQTNDLHGVSAYMDKHQLNDLIEFLKTL
jgi:DNA-binding beta-propeller fold protein YncE